jgi:hypothetical protein
VTRYGFAIKALPKGGKPFGDEDDEQNEETAAPEEEALEGPAPEPPADLPEDPAATTDPVEPADPLEGAGDDATGEIPPPPADDARPWSGDMYDEGDETEPEEAFAAYTGNGEQAWLDQAPDGTLTGWVRDSTGQVWRYTNVDAWATDVDDAQMTRTHSRAEGGDTTGDPATPGDPAQPSDRGAQDLMFADQ